MASSPELFDVNDSWESEKEVGVLIAAFIACMKPDLVVELGVHSGTTTRQIGEALGRNDIGRCIAYETDANLSQAIFDRVEIRNEDSISAAVDFDRNSIDILFVDGSPDREKEYFGWLPNVRPGGVIFFHNACDSVDNMWIHKYTDILLRMRYGTAIIQKRPVIYDERLCLPVRTDAPSTPILYYSC